MKTPKTLTLIECRTCNGSYFANDKKLVLYPGTVSELPDEVSIIVRKVAKCFSCKTNENRTNGIKSNRQFKRP